MNRLEVFSVSLPLKIPFETSFGVQRERDALLFRYVSDVEAYGESVTDSVPGYSYECNGTALYIIENHLIPLLKETDEPAEFIEKSKKIKGHNMAKSAIETTLWDLKAKRAGKNLKDMIGGTKAEIDSGISIGILPMQQLLAMVKASLERGYKRIKLKIKPGWDAEVVKRVRDEFGDIPLTVDANQAFGANPERILELDRFDLMMIEQPLEESDLFGSSKLQKKMNTPICLDESIHSVADVKRMVEMDAGKIVNLKVGRVGGLGESLRIVDYCGKNAIPIWCGGMLETGVGRALNVILQSRSEFRLPGDTSPSDRYFEKDVISSPFVMERGSIRVPSGSGLGVQLDLPFVKSASKRILSFEIAES